MTARFVERDAIKMTHYLFRGLDVARDQLEVADSPGRDKRMAVLGSATGIHWMRSVRPWDQEK